MDDDWFFEYQAIVKARREIDECGVRSRYGMEDYYQQLVERQHALINASAGLPSAAAGSTGSGDPDQDEEDEYAGKGCAGCADRDMRIADYELELDNLEKGHLNLSNKVKTLEKQVNTVVTAAASIASETQSVISSLKAQLAEANAEISVLREAAIIKARDGSSSFGINKRSLEDVV